MRLPAFVLALAAASGLQAQPAPSAQRGQLLYENHCVECHSVRMHWRDQRLVRDWPTLKYQVWRWQDAARLGWSPQDIDDVSRYLNDTIYGFPQATTARR